MKIYVVVDGTQDGGDVLLVTLDEELAKERQKEWHWKYTKNENEIQIWENNECIDTIT